jgi:hypothetical protein
MSGTLSIRERNAKKAKIEKVFVRMSSLDLLEVKKNADKYAGGNVSKWIRDRASKPMLDVSIKMQNEIDGGFDEG